MDTENTQSAGHPSALPDDTFWVELNGLGCYGTVRLVTVPQHEPKNLDSVFKYGQNDFQPLKMRSVSVGDVIYFKDGHRYRVDNVGFSDLGEWPI
jgi:hypothetical protein